jgi:hypothetical protein
VAILAGLMAVAVLTGPVMAPAMQRPTSPGQLLGPVYVVDQLRCGAPPKELMPQLQPLHDLPEVEALLRKSGISCVAARAYLDTNAADPRLVAGINNLPPGEIFVTPAGQAVMFNKIIGKR